MKVLRVRVSEEEVRREDESHMHFVSRDEHGAADREAGN